MKAIIVFAMLPFTAFAGGEHDPPPMPKHPTQAQYQDQEQSQSQANSQSVTIEDRAQAPSISAPSVFPTAQCQSGVSIGGSGAGGGGLLGFSFSKKECELMLLAQSYASIGMTVAACEVLNKTKAAQRAYGDHKPACFAPIPVPQSQAQNPPPAAVVSQGEDCANREKAAANRVLERCVAK